MKAPSGHHYKCLKCGFIWTTGTNCPKCGRNIYDESDVKK